MWPRKQALHTIAILTGTNFYGGDIPAWFHIPSLTTVLSVTYTYIYIPYIMSKMLPRIHY